MPFVGVGLHLLVALFFAVHVVRNGQPTFWPIVPFSFPLLGSIVDCVAIRLRADADRAMQCWDRLTRESNRSLMRRLDAAFAGMKSHG